MAAALLAPFALAPGFEGEDCVFGVASGAAGAAVVFGTSKCSVWNHGCVLCGSKELVRAKTRSRFVCTNKLFFPSTRKGLVEKHGIVMFGNKEFVSVRNKELVV